MPSLEEKEFLLSQAANFTPILILLEDVVDSFAFTANPVTDVLYASEHNFVDGMRIKINNLGGGLPGGILSDTIYYVVNASANEFQIAESKGGAALDLTGAGSGTNVATEEAPGIEDNLSALVRHEIDYLGGTRGIFPIPTVSLNVSAGRAETDAIETIIAPSTGESINFRYACIVRGGTSTPGDVSGTIVEVLDLGEDVITDVGRKFQITMTLS